MVLLLIISLLTLTVYLSYIIIKFGIQNSISDTYKLLKQKWIFTVILWATVLPIIIFAENGILFFAGVGIAFVGASPKFWEELEGKVHKISAISGITLAVIYIFLSNFWLLSVFYSIFVLTINIKIKGKNIIFIKNKVWWMEVIIFFFLFIVLFSKI